MIHYLKTTFLIFCAISVLHAGESGLFLQRGDRLALCGDSITEQKQYTVFVETYLRACTPELQIKVIQVGQQGENTTRFLERMDFAALAWKPTIATTCYGMNDGTGSPWDDSLGQTYRKNLAEIAQRFTANGCRMVLGSPGVLDTTTMQRKEPTVESCNVNLSRFGGIAKELAASKGYGFADVHTAMATAMPAAKAAYGSDYHVAGADGVHPASNGHLCMAYGFLRAFGLDGVIGTIEFAWPSAARATKGHEIRSSKDGIIELVSTRYPFCFPPVAPGAKPDPKDASSILPFLPFQRDLNRLILKANSLPSARAEVTWGKNSLIFTREQLNAGINLAEHFTDNPFLEPFLNVQRAVTQKQDNETLLARDLLPSLRHWNRHVPYRENAEVQAAVKTLRDQAVAALEASQEPTQATVVSVTHTLRIRPIE